jgi:hypothetical protein
MGKAQFMFRRFIGLGLAIVLSFIFVAPASGSIILLSNSPVTENFDSMPSSGTTGLVATVGTHNALPGLTGFEGTKTGGSGSTLNFVADSGTSNSGRLGSLGPASDSDRALGALASGTVRTAFGVEIVNNTGADLPFLKIDAFREQWRSSTSVQNVLSFAWALSGGSATSSNYLTDGSLASLASLDLVGEPPVVSNGATDGNTLRVAITGTISTIIPDGSSVFIRWSDVDDAGSDAALAVDDMTITVPEPATVALLSLGLVGLVRRRRAA